MKNDKPEIAEAHINANRSIIPLIKNDKKPNGSWIKYQKERMTPQQAYQYFEKNPEANIGLVTGKISGISVIDIDGEEGFEALKKANIELPKTSIVKTPRGWHYYYKYNPDLKQGANRLEKVDIRNDGGYVVIPPSSIDGVHYKNDYSQSEYIRKFDIKVPEDFRGVYTSLNTNTPKKTEISKPKWVAEALENGVDRGRRNDVASRLVGYFHSKGIAEDIIFTTLKEFANKCTPSMTEQELLVIIRSISRYSQTRVISYQGNVVPPPLMDSSNDRIRTFIWTEWGLKIVAESIRKTIQGIHCKLSVSSTEQGHMYMGRLNLHSASQKQQFVRDLKGRAEYDWQGIINHIAKLIEDSVDAPEEILDLAKVEKIKDDPFVIYPFMRNGNPVILYGDGGEGKSIFAIGIGLSIATGKNFIPSLEVNQTGNVMYLDWEQEAEDIADIMNKMCLGMNIDVPTDKFLYRRMVGSLSDHLEAVHRDILANDIKMIIIDSLVASSSGDVNDSETARILFNSVRAFKVSAIIITHVSKTDEGKPYGSIFFWNYARNVWMLAKSQETGLHSSIVGLFHKKSNRNMLNQPIGLEVEFTDKSIKYLETDLQDEPELSVRTTVADQIQGLLKNLENGLPVNRIAEELEKTESQIRKELNRKSRGRDIRFENKHGNWVLATQVPRNVPRNSINISGMASTPPKGGGNVATPTNDVLKEDKAFDENVANEKLKKILGEDNG